MKRSTVLPHVVADFAGYWETSQSNACLLHFAAGPLLKPVCGCGQLWTRCTHFVHYAAAAAAAATEAAADIFWLVSIYQ